jgi:hypothetical protein
LDTVMIRDTLSIDDQSGRGLEVGVHAGTGVPASLSLTHSVIERNFTVGLASFGAPTDVSSSIIRDVLPGRAGSWGRGIHIADESTWDVRGGGSVRGSVVQRTHEFGIATVGTNLLIEDTLITDTLAEPATQSYGDGMACAATTVPAALTVVRSRIERSARAGLTNFGSEVTLSASELLCNPLDLNAQDYEGRSYVFHDEQNNRCGCDNGSEACRVLTTMLDAPQPLDDAQ